MTSHLWCKNGIKKFYYNPEYLTKYRWCPKRLLFDFLKLFLSFSCKSLCFALCPRKSRGAIKHIWLIHKYIYICWDNFVERLGPSKCATRQYYPNQSTSSPLPRLWHPQEQFVYLYRSSLNFTTLFHLFFFYG